MSLSPLLALSAVQAIVDFEQAARQRRTILGALAADAAQSAEHAIQGARVLLEGLAAQDDVRAGGLSCVRALRNAILAVDEYSNLAYVSPEGDLACSAVSPQDPINVASEGWFRRIQTGSDFVVGDAIVSALTSDTVITAAVPAGTTAPVPPGALVASIKVAEIQDIDDRATLPAGTQVALVDAQGRVVGDGAPLGARAIAAELLASAAADGVAFHSVADDSGAIREIVIAPLVGDDVFVALTAPAPGLLAWFWLDALGRVLLPVLMWVLAILTVWLATDQLIVRWLSYLRRVAELYGEGRLDIAPSKTKAAPHEIRVLARTLEAMAVSLRERESELAESLAQKESLLKEIHHRVKNNLQIIVSLLNIQAGEAAPEAQAALSAARERIFALAQVHKSLYESPDLDRVRLPSFFRDLIAHLAAASGAHEQGVRIAAEAPDVSLPSGSAASLALFVIEAVTNSLKHAFGEAGGEVLVSGRLRDDGRLEFAVDDSGRGFVETRSADSVGGSLMTAFARQLGGSIEQGRSTLGGARVALAFPLAGGASAPALDGSAPGTTAPLGRYAPSRAGDAGPPAAQQQEEHRDEAQAADRDHRDREPRRAGDGRRILRGRHRR